MFIPDDYVPSHRTREDLDRLMGILGDDFIERDGHGFIYQAEGQGLRWQDDIPGGDSLSDVFLGMTDKKGILLRAYDIARDTVAVMDTGVRPRIIIDPRNSSGATDGKNLLVTTKVFDDEGIAPGEAADVFVGIVAHEGCHLKWTDFGVVGTIKGRLLHSLHNIVEDERIEHLLGGDRPALAGFLKATKYYFFGKTFDGIDFGALTPTQELFNAVLALIRYPSVLRPSDIDLWGDALAEVREVLKAWPEDTQGAVRTAERILEIILKWAPPEDDPEEEPQDGEPGDGEPHEGGSGGDDESDDSDTDRSLRKISEKELEERVEAIIAAIDDIERSTDGGDEENASEMVKGDPFIQARAERECGRVSGGDAMHAVETIAEPVTEETQRRYDITLSEVKPYVGAFREALKRNAAAYTETLRGLRSGTLDTGKLAEAFQGSPTVYSRKGLVRSEPMAVCVLIDESGSMEGGAKGKTRIDCARAAAVLISEAARGVNGLDLFVFGHSADNYVRGVTELLVYQDHTRHERKALGNSRARWNNADGYAILECAARIRKQTSQPCLLFVLSDGDPAACVYRTSYDGVIHTRKVVREVTRMGFLPVHVWIGGCEETDTMFQDVVRFESLPALATDLAKLIKKTVIRHSARKSG